MSCCRNANQFRSMTVAYPTAAAPAATAMEVNARARTYPWCHVSHDALSGTVRLGQDRGVDELKERLRADLSAAMRARDQVRLRTLRMALTSITNEEVSGDSARQLSDEEIVRILTREAKKRREAADAFESAGRAEAAAAERAEGDVLADYLPAQLTDQELSSMVSAAIAETGAVGMPGMGKVMKAVTPRIAGRADGARVAAEVRRQLASAT